VTQWDWSRRLIGDDQVNDETGTSSWQIKDHVFTRPADLLYFHIKVRNREIHRECRCRPSPDGQFAAFTGSGRCIIGSIVFKSVIPTLIAGLGFSSLATAQQHFTLVTLE
jgi:hypothetical protein